MDIILYFLFLLYAAVWICLALYFLYYVYKRLTFFVDQLQNKTFYTIRDLGEMIFGLWFITSIFCLYLLSI